MSRAFLRSCVSNFEQGAFMRMIAVGLQRLGILWKRVAYLHICSACDIIMFGVVI